MNPEKKELKVSFDIHTIDNLGVKLYSTIPPMIAELVSNAWDADAKNVWLYFSDGEKTIKIVDDGRGMSFDELNDQFLRVGRNRRVDLNTDITESGRKILGKKGLGKLSMFGIGKRITVTTVKDSLKNSFVMDYDLIKQCDHNEYKPEILTYMQPVDEPNGTSILIEQIKKRSPFDAGKIRSSLLSRFRIFSEGFVVHINDRPEYDICSSELEPHQYQFKWSFPADFVDQLQRTNDGQLLLSFAISKGITGAIYTTETPLNLDRRGIVLFSRNKLVQENTPFNNRANDNFFQYMTGSFDVDFVDEKKDIDNCSTDRKSLAWDNSEDGELDTLKAFLEKIVSITQRKWRESRKKSKKERIAKKGQDVDEWLKTLNGAERPLARKLTSAILENDDVDDDTVANYISDIKDMYGFQGFKDYAAKLDDMHKLSDDDAMKLLTDWETIEEKEYAKIATGRIATIEQFEKYIKEDVSETKVMQKFLEEFPWLLDPKMSKFEREVTYSKILKENFPDDDKPETDRRLDFLCTNDSGEVHIIELKRPSIKITTKGLSQIAEYTEFIRSKYPDQVSNIKGYLISDNITYGPGAETMKKGLESQNIFVKSYSDLLAQARNYNKELYDSYHSIHEIIDKEKNDTDDGKKNG